MKVDLYKSQSSWSRGLRLRRLAWETARILLWPRYFRRFSWLRKLLLRAFGAKIGEKVLIMGGVRVWLPWELEIGGYSAIGTDVEIYNFSRVSIGERTVISQKCYLCTASHDYQSPHMTLFSLPITIGSEVWIAASTTVLPGVTVGDGSVVGAASVVTRSVPEWSVAAGNPCRVIKTRVVNDLGTHTDKERGS
jgi:putative colanic acid biosynthesis acetyltransferase WcaF